MIGLIKWDTRSLYRLWLAGDYKGILGVLIRASTWSTCSNSHKKVFKTEAPLFWGVPVLKDSLGVWGSCWAKLPCGSVHQDGALL